MGQYHLRSVLDRKPQRVRLRFFIGLAAIRDRVRTDVDAARKSPIVRLVCLSRY